MKFQNESTTDRIIRVVAGVALLALAFGGLVSGTLGLIFKIVGGLALVTGAIGYCPLYGLLKFSTNKTK